MRARQQRTGKEPTELAGCVERGARARASGEGFLRPVSALPLAVARALRGVGEGTAGYGAIGRAKAPPRSRTGPLVCDER